MHIYTLAAVSCVAILASSSYSQAQLRPESGFDTPTLGGGSPTVPPRIDKKSRARSSLFALIAKLKLTGPSYEPRIPAALQTRFEVQPPDQTPSAATLHIDSTGDRLFFPMPERGRIFANEAELAKFVAKTFGGIPATAAKGDWNGLSHRGAYTWEGSAYFFDPRLESPLRVDDPVLAYLGGLQGTIELGGRRVCIDSDGDCDHDYASYLEPIGEATARPQIEHCGREYAGIPVCVMHTSFFNKAWVWARHGANVRLTYFAPLPSTHMTATGSLAYPTGDGAFVDYWPLPFAETRGAGSVETAHWCLFGPCIPLDAEAVCGSTYVYDPDVSGSRATGNGPRNSELCGP